MATEVALTKAEITIGAIESLVLFHVFASSIHVIAKTLLHGRVACLPNRSKTREEVIAFAYFSGKPSVGTWFVAEFAGLGGDAQRMLGKLLKISGAG